MNTTSPFTAVDSLDPIFHHWHTFRPERWQFRVGCDKKKSNGVRWHERGGHSTGPFLEITRSPNLPFNKWMLKFIQFWPQIIFQHSTMALSIDGNMTVVFIHEKIRPNHTFGMKTAPNSHFLRSYKDTKLLCPYWKTL